MALDAVLEADQERLKLLAEEKDLKKVSSENSEEGFKANERLMEVYKRLKEINAFSAEGRYVTQALVCYYQYADCRTVPRPFCLACNSPKK